jgi:predicted TIM-barrel enzyme
MTSDITPVHVGEMVAEAIERDEPYVVTHTGVWTGVEKRFDAIKAACDYREQAA